MYTVHPFTYTYIIDLSSEKAPFGTSFLPNNSISSALSHSTKDVLYLHAFYIQHYILIKHYKIQRIKKVHNNYKLETQLARDQCKQGSRLWCTTTKAKSYTFLLHAQSIIYMYA